MHTDTYRLGESTVVGIIILHAGKPLPFSTMLVEIACIEIIQGRKTIGTEYTAFGVEEHRGVECDGDHRHGELMSQQASNEIGIGNNAANESSLLVESGSAQHDGMAHRGGWVPLFVGGIWNEIDVTRGIKRW